MNFLRVFAVVAHQALQRRAVAFPEKAPHARWRLPRPGRSGAAGSAFICSCIDGKMCGRASCSVLSRSKIHTRRDGGYFAMRIYYLLRISVPTPVVGQHFEQQRVRHAAVDDVAGLHAGARGVEHRGDLRQHAAGDHALGDQVVDFLRRQAGEQLAVLVEHARRVGEHDQLLGAQDLGQLAGDQVGVDVVGDAVRAGADRRHHRDEAARSRAPRSPAGRWTRSRPPGRGRPCRSPW